MREINRTSNFKRDTKRIFRGAYDVSELLDVISELQKGNTLAPKFQDHALTGKMKGFRECHIRPDWLLMYRFEKNKIILVRTGSHAELFG
jgi:mRNA interferase YafQ